MKSRQTDRQINVPVNRFSRLSLANGKSLRNRVVIPPMASQTANQAGFVTEKTLAHYGRLAQASPGLLIVEYTFVHLSGRSEDFQLGIQSDGHIAGLSQLANTIQDSGALAGIQITHGGAKSERSLTGGVLMGPSAIAVPVKDRELEIPDAMTLEEIEEVKASFIGASDRAVRAGFDLIELHAAHGYGLNQWLSPITNNRSDVYGGDLPGRMRFLLEIVTTIRARYPRLLISVRMPGQDFLDGGLLVTDTLLIAQGLEKTGVNIIHVSSGIGGWKRPSTRIGEGYLVAEAEKIQAAVKIPVIGVGGIETGAFIDQSLQEGRFSLAAVGRAILQDPKSWKEKNLTKPMLYRAPVKAPGPNRGLHCKIANRKHNRSHDLEHLICSARHFITKF